MSVRAEAKPVTDPSNATTAAIEAAQGENTLAEGNNFAVAQSDNPLQRNIVVSIRATLNDLCLQKQRGTWAPSQEALRSICTLQIELFPSVSSLTPPPPRSPAAALASNEFRPPARARRALTPPLPCSTSLEGAAESMGDLKSIVLHNMETTHVKSTFPMSACKRFSTATRTLLTLAFVRRPRHQDHGRRRRHLLGHRRSLLGDP